MVFEGDAGCGGIDFVVCEEYFVFESGGDLTEGFGISGQGEEVASGVCEHAFA